MRNSQVSVTKASLRRSSPLRITCSGRSARAASSPFFADAAQSVEDFAMVRGSREEGALLDVDSLEGLGFCAVKLWRQCPCS